MFLVQRYAICNKNKDKCNKKVCFFSFLLTYVNETHRFVSKSKWNVAQNRKVSYLCGRNIAMCKTRQDAND